ncbi:MAG: hypothetical protein IPK20_22555 [Betaproteobacteria bacterium]|nr:hypothetical protein [Betaproteobacteria bacterium]
MAMIVVLSTDVPQQRLVFRDAGPDELDDRVVLELRTADRRGDVLAVAAGIRVDLGDDQRQQLGQQGDGDAVGVRLEVAHQEVVGARLGGRNDGREVARQRAFVGRIEQRGGRDGIVPHEDLVGALVVRGFQGEPQRLVARHLDLEELLLAVSQGERERRADQQLVDGNLEILR